MDCVDRSSFDLTEMISRNSLPSPSLSSSSSLSLGRVHCNTVNVDKLNEEDCAVAGCWDRVGWKAM